MEQSLRIPNLPAGQVRFCISSLPPQANERLISVGVEVCAPLPDPALPAEEQSHADLLFCHAGENTLFCAPSQMPLLPLLQRRGFSITYTGAPGPAYPANVPLNVAVGDGLALGNFRYCDPLLRETLSISGRRLLTVNQGYAKCAVCFVSAKAYITEDAGIAKALRDAGCSVLLVSAGDVYLSEKHYGFFGGAAGKLAPDLLAVNGSLKTHRDGESITAFLLRFGVRPLELHDGRITDVGGILPLTEEGA